MAMSMPVMPWISPPARIAKITTSGCTRKRLPMITGTRMWPSTSWIRTKVRITQSAESGESNTATTLGGTAASTGPR